MESRLPEQPAERAPAPARASFPRSRFGPITDRVVPRAGTWPTGRTIELETERRRSSPAAPWRPSPPPNQRLVNRREARRQQSRSLYPSTVADSASPVSVGAGGAAARIPASASAWPIGYPLRTSQAEDASLESPAPQWEFPVAVPPLARPRP